VTTLDLRSVRAIVTDANVLGRLDPAKVAAYLQRASWFIAHERRGGAVWSRWLGDHAAKLLVPNDPTFGDYAIRMSEVLAALALTEDRSQLAVLADLCEASHGAGARTGEPASATVDVDALRRLLDKATPRPWKVADLLDPAVSAFAEGARGCHEDAELTAAAVNTLPSLLDELERWRTRAESAASLYETAVEERDAMRRRAEAAEGDWHKAEADLEALRRTTEAGREFHRLWHELQQGIASFDLHNQTVAQFEAAEATFRAALKEEGQRDG